MDELDELLQKISDGDAEVAAAIEFVRTDREQRFRAAIGPIYDAISANRDEAITALRHEDASVRKVAIQMFPHHWPADKDVEDICQRQTHSGPIDVRLCAINTLSIIRNKLYGKKVSSTLAEYALNPTVDWELRRSLYSLLLVFFGTTAQKQSQYQIIQAPRDRDQIDPLIVKQCIEQDHSA
jgi:hypothetical protein